MKYNFDEVQERRNTDCAKWDHMDLMDKRATSTTLPFWVADMEFKVAHEIIEALHKRVDHGIFGYTRQGETYYQAIINWYKKRFEWDIKRDSILYAAGIVPALGFLVDALTNINEGVIVQPPVYYPFSNIINNHNRKLIANNLINEDGYYTIDFDDLKKKASDSNNTMMFFCSPHNPVGRVWSKEEILKVYEICKETKTILIVDEIHCDLIRNNKQHYPLMSLIDDKTNVVSTVAPSKSFNLAGLQVSIIISEDESIKEKYLKSIDLKFSSANISSLGLVAAQAAYEHGEDWLNQVNEYIDSNLDYIAEFVKENIPDVKYIIPEGSYLAWLDLSAYGKADVLMERFIVEQDIFIEDGRIFGDVKESYFRINVACPRVQLEECLKRIAIAIK